MPGSFIKRHRTICMVLEEIRSVLERSSEEAQQISVLVDEAKDYAQRMSAKLVEYKHFREQFSEAQVERLLAQVWSKVPPPDVE